MKAKSLDVSKAIDARGGNAHRAGEIATAIREAREARGWTTGQADHHFCGGSTNWTWYEGRKGICRPPTTAAFARIAEEWPELAPMAELVAEVEREVIGRSDEMLGRRSGIGNGTSEHYTVGGTRAEAYDLTAPATPDAQRWQGFGTAMAPAHEPIVCARKPLIGTVAANVLEHGAGGLNIDKTRIGAQWDDAVSLCDSCAADADAKTKPGTVVTRASTAPGHVEPTTSGRVPTNPCDASTTATGCSGGPSPEEQSTTRSGDGSLSTGECGSPSTDPSPMDTSSTTSTKTARTTASRICNSCGAAITTGSTTSASQKSAGRWPKNCVLVHNDTCRAIGERRVKTGQITKPYERQNRGGFAGPMPNEASTVDHADPDGTETITAWDCTPGCPIAALDAQTGVLKSGSGPLMRNGDKFRNAYGKFQGGSEPADVLYGDAGGASRFFFQSKASTAQRNAMDLSLLPRARSARKRYQQGAANRWAPRVRNWHSTVKPLELMRWLVRLVGGQPGSTILDCFAGSGTTGIACMLEGFRFIGIERDAGYVSLARARIAWWAEHPEGVEVDTALQADRQRKRVAEGGQLGFTFDDGEEAA